ncbi:hypothetical protein [Aestuariibaculum suncheonense]|uniref:Uncharacterized protein n=1 Tax=Aestuariibaculum suncheonense TaxID=1028745 RepID=A0A8J6UAA7_9FLAO|nr:hypothetical protein [Aestuariibaculum suncheonense]MBD0834690.1 hypothetical protein [Aestuariibaculum suncheonense]
MVLNNIEKLLEKYENGETSLKEEQLLKNYFAQEAVPPHLEMYKAMFGYFKVNKQEQFTKHVPLKTNKVFNYKWISVAAVAVLMLGFYFKSTSKSNNDLGTYQDPQQAYNEVAKSLAMISGHFNKGVSSVAYLNEYEKGYETLNYLTELENSTRIIFKANH